MQRIATIAAFTAVAVGGLWVSLPEEPSGPPREVVERTVDPRFAAFERATGVPVAYDGADPVRPEIDVALEVLRTGLLRYPPRVRRKLTHITLSDELRNDQGKVRGKSVGGGRIQISLDYAGQPVRMSRTVHHELAHVLYGQPEFPKARWKALSTAGPEANEAPGAPLERGFVTQYASKNPSEDFAEMAELQFVHPAKLDRLAAGSPAIRDKRDVLLEHYDAVDPRIELWVYPRDDDGQAAVRTVGRR